MENFDYRAGKMNMLPNAWKKWGFTVAAVVFVAELAVPFIFANKPPLDYFSSVMSIALLTAAVSKDKQEDEMVRQMRLTAFFSAFVFVVGFVAVQPVVMTAVGSDGEYLTAHFAVLMMLLSYHYTFYSMKRRARRE